MSDNIAKSLSEIVGSYESLEAEYNKEIEIVDGKIKELAKYLKNIRQLAASQGDFYSYYQVLISRRRAIRKFIANLIKPIKREERAVLDSYKVGISKSDYVKDVTILPKNDFERTMYIEVDLEDVYLVKKLAEGHLEFLTDSIDNIQRMILGIKYSIEMEKYRESMG